jgi:hypothetical protein
MKKKNSQRECRLGEILAQQRLRAEQRRFFVHELHEFTRIAGLQWRFLPSDAFLTECEKETR